MHLLREKLHLYYKFMRFLKQCFCSQNQKLVSLKPRAMLKTWFRNGFGLDLGSCTGPKDPLVDSKNLRSLEVV